MDPPIRGQLHRTHRGIVFFVFCFFSFGQVSSTPSKRCPSVLFSSHFHVAENGDGLGGPCHIQSISSLK